MVNLACIGCGNRGRQIVRIGQRIPSLSVVAYADTKEEAARACYKDFGGRYYTTDMHRIMGDDRIDAVAIATWGISHASLAMQAMRAGKHVYVEKPMALNVSDCLRMQEMAVSSGVKLTVGFIFRFSPAVQKVKELIKRPLVTVGQVCEEEVAPDHFSLDPTKDGHPLLSTGSHLLDMVCWLNPSEPIRVYAEGGALTHPGLGMIDNFVATVLFENGSVGAIVQTQAGKSEYTSKWFVEVFDGGMTATLHDHWCRAELTGGPEDLVVADGPDGTGHMLGALLAAFADCIVKDTPPPVPARDGTRATLLAEKIIESIKMARPREIEL